MWGRCDPLGLGLSLSLRRRRSGRPGRGGATQDGFHPGDPAVGLLDGLGRGGRAPAGLVAWRPHGDLEIGMAGVVEDQSQGDLAGARRRPLQGAAGLAAIGPGPDLPIDDQFGPDQLVDPVDQAPGALVPGHGGQVAGEVEPDPSAIGDDHGVGGQFEDVTEGPTNAPLFVHEPYGGAAGEGHRRARQGQP